jgi:hypothetical protein
MERKRKNKVNLVMPKETLRSKGRVDNFSGFFLTINTNVSVAERDDPLINTFRDVVVTLCENIWEYIKVLDGKEKDDERYFPHSIEVKPTVEVGKKYHKLHAHIVITLEHRSKIHLNLARIRNYLHDRLEGEGVKKSRVFVETFSRNDTKYGQSQGGDFQSIVNRYVEKDNGMPLAKTKRRGKKRST